MELILQRKYRKQKYTIGNLLINGECFCNTLEPPIGTDEEAHTSGSGKAIPYGTYNLRLVWSQKFQEYLPLIEDIPPKQGGLEGLLGDRSGILIHAGNHVADTHGCILVGKNKKVGRLLESRVTLNPLIRRIRKALKQKEQVIITITD